MDIKSKSHYPLFRKAVAASSALALLALLVRVLTSFNVNRIEAVCSSNLHMLGQAMQMYVDDNDGTYPPVVGARFDERSHVRSPQKWSTLLIPYAPHGPFPTCPAVVLKGRLRAFARNPGTSGYAYNGRLNRGAGAGRSHYYYGRQSSEVARPALTVILYEARVGIVSGLQPDRGSTSDDLDAVFTPDFLQEILAQGEGATRHRGGSNYEFADGHVRWLAPDAVQGRRNDRARPAFGL